MQAHFLSHEKTESHGCILGEKCLSRPHSSDKESVSPRKIIQFSVCLVVIDKGENHSISCDHPTTKDKTTKRKHVGGDRRNTHAYDLEGKLGVFDFDKTNTLICREIPASELRLLSSLTPLRNYLLPS